VEHHLFRGVPLALPVAVRSWKAPAAVIRFRSVDEPTLPSALCRERAGLRYGLRPASVALPPSPHVCACAR